MSAVVDRPSDAAASQQSLYLSRFTLNQRNPLVRAELGNSQAMHRRLLDAFPNESGRQACGLLYRIDQTGQVPKTRLVVLAQSFVQPDWSRLPEGYALGGGSPGWALDSPVDVKPIGQIIATIDEGDVYRFRVRANPTKRVSFKKLQEENPRWAAQRRDGRGPRVAIQDQQGLQAWIERKGDQHGFRVGSFSVAPDPVTGSRQVGQKRRGDQPMKLTHQAILFDGILQVTDAELFRATLRTGIGSGKAYGFGLLSIAPPVRQS
jgi:CRISPR system Cascade subunit CasE